MYIEIIINYFSVYRGCLRIGLIKEEMKEDYRIIFGSVDWLRYYNV